MKEEDLEKIFNTVVWTIQWYMETYRKTTQHKKLILQDICIADYNPDEESIQESLIEHVWSLPVLASLLYPHISDPEVNLWDSLIMLAIHDIGELVTWDKLSFTKHLDDSTLEKKEAYKLLDASYYNYYEQIENQSTQSWKFAKSIDKIIADIIDFLCPAEVVRIRYTIHAWVEPDHIIELKRTYKAKYMERNPFLKDFFEYSLSRLEAHILS